MSQNPSIAIKTATELLAVDRKDAALQALIDAFQRKNKNQWTQDMETVIVMLLDLCVKTQNLKAVKDGLHQYRSFCQSGNSASLEKVIVEFLYKCELHLKDVIESADKLTSNEEEETIESTILRSISGEDLAERTRKLYLAPYFKFMWESFRAILDLVRNRPKSESAYLITASKAMKFCVTHERKQEFKRIGEMFRAHFSQLITHGGTQPASIPTAIISANSLRDLVNIRFEYLDHAIKLELYQEAFKTVEDINEIIVHRQAPPQALAKYYEKLAQLFFVSHNYLYHAYAWLRFYVLSRNQHLTLTEEKIKQIASVVLIASLSVPIESDGSDQFSEFHLQKEKNARLTSLLGLHSTLRRDTLLKEIFSVGIPLSVNRELLEVYEIAESRFAPLHLCSSLQSAFAYIEQTDSLKQYAKLFKKTAFTRQLQQIAQVYQTAKLEHVYKCSPFESIDTTEKLIFKATSLHLINARVDYQKNAVTFGSSAFESSSIKNQLSVVYEKLSSAVRLIDPQTEQKRLENKKKFFAEAPDQVQEEYEQNLDRLDAIEQEKIRLEKIDSLKERVAALKEKLRSAKQPKPQIVIPETQVQIEQKEKEKEAEKKAAEKVQPVVDPVKEREDKREALQKQFNKTIVYLDYIERARREVEAPLLAQWFEKSIEQDRQIYQQQQQANLEKAKTVHEEDLKAKARLSKMKDFKNDYQKKLLERQGAAFEEQLTKVRQNNEKIRKQIDEEVAKIRTELIARQKEEKIRKAKEEERKQREKEQAEKAAQEQREREEEAARNRPEKPLGSSWAKPRSDAQPESTGSRGSGWGDRARASERDDRSGSNFPRREPEGNERPGWGRSSDRERDEQRDSRASKWGDDSSEGRSWRDRPSAEPTSDRPPRGAGWGKKPEESSDRPASGWGARRTEESSDRPASGWGAKRTEDNNDRPNRRTEESSDRPSSGWGARRTEESTDRPRWGAGRERDDRPPPREERAETESSWRKRTNTRDDRPSDRPAERSGWGRSSDRSSDKPSERNEERDSSWRKPRSEQSDDKPQSNADQSRGAGWGRKAQQANASAKQSSDSNDDGFTVVQKKK